MKTFFRCENANRLIEGVKFEPIEHIMGTLIGVYQSSDPETAKKLQKYAKDPKSAVEEISEERYVSELKKKSPRIKGLNALESSLQTGASEPEGQRPCGSCPRG
jgi:hypothetical protein